MGDLVRCVAGFEDSVRKFVCHVISITYQNILDETLCEQLGLVDENAVNQGLLNRKVCKTCPGHKIDILQYVIFILKPLSKFFMAIMPRSRSTFSVASLSSGSRRTVGSSRRRRRATSSSRVRTSRSRPRRSRKRSTWTRSLASWPRATEHLTFLLFFV